MTSGKILVEHADDITTITFNRPEHLNALEPATVEEFMQVLREVDAGPSTRGHPHRSGHARSPQAATSRRSEPALTPGCIAGVGASSTRCSTSRSRSWRWSTARQSAWASRSRCCATPW